MVTKLAQKLLFLLFKHFNILLHFQARISDASVSRIGYQATKTKGQEKQRPAKENVPKYVQIQSLNYNKSQTE
ncbi:hypothetical protein BSZ40_10540 [Buchananella hordeovulneris]|uniref:Uncharacterized protein n=1 Tax=Buchananella hordeovulneris TaxID=52770 RepID=A0A1Q5PTR3_9ACTO|nr:hypothetical protein BSZ40_10540 [Buchananella hordeovulneris]